MKKYFTVLFFFLSVFSSDIYSQWYVQHQSTGVIYDVRFLDRNTGWACGGGMILKTVNGGNNWTVQNFNATFNQIHPVNDRVIYACGYYVIYKSTDGGDKWYAVSEGVNQAPILYGLWFIDENTGWFCGDRSVMRTTNGGETFIDSMFMTNTCNDIHFKDSNTGNIAANSRMFRTTNSGVSWTPVVLPSPLVTPFVEKLSFKGDTGWVVTRGRLVYRTTNYGISWDTISRVAVGTSETMDCIEFADSYTGYAGGYNGKIYKSTNGGFNWTLSLQVGVGSFVSIFSYSDSIVWATGGSGKILHTTNGGLTFINNTISEIPKSFILHQNYPNPFNPSTIISYELHNTENISLKIFDITGNEVSVLVNYKQNAGKYNIKFNGENFSSGIYFCKLESKDFSETRKMILTK